MAKQERTAALPVGEELEALARHYHHLQVEHQRGRRALAKLAR